MDLNYSLSWSFTIFIMLTIGYGILKKFFGPRSPDDDTRKNSGGIILLMYMIITLIVQLISNFSNAKSVCEGSSQPFFKIFLYTIMPYFFIFGTIVLLINIKKGWLNPFSNTIGYLIAMIIFKGNKSFNTILNAYRGDSDDDSEQQRMIKTICKDKSLVSNELSGDNYSGMMNVLFPDIIGRFGKKLGGTSSSETKAEALSGDQTNSDGDDGRGDYSKSNKLEDDTPSDSSDEPNSDGTSVDQSKTSLEQWNQFGHVTTKSEGTAAAHDEPVNDLEKAYNSLFRMVLLKDIVAECIWFLLAGCLAISIETNIITSVECDYDPATIKKQKEEAEKKHRENTKPPIKYTKHT